jgi:LmbE family N-acetylglucosaminyl deacetylase
VKQLKVRHVIELAAGLAGITPAQIEDPDAIFEGGVIGAAVMVSWVNTDASVEDLARIFSLDPKFVRTWVNWNHAWHPEFEAFVELLQKAVVRLKAAWRREAEMERWRAAQEPIPRAYGRWQPRSTTEAVELTRSRLRQRPSIWTEVETPAPVGAQKSAA